ncbi:MAG: DUF2341 domain-containing protein [Minisyncoccia bacterium]
MSAAGWLTGWTYRKQITISNTNVGAALPNFPLLVKIAETGGGSTNIGYNLSDKINGGYDIRFTDSNGTVLSYERESFSDDSNNLIANFWVKVPTVSHTAPTVIYIYYGNSDQKSINWTATAGADADTINCASPVTPSQCVWKEGASQNYKGVWHLKEATGVNDADSTSNGNTGTPQGSPTQTDGQIDGSLSFNGNQGVSTDNTGNKLDILGALTYSAWIKPSSFANYPTVMSKMDMAAAKDCATWLGFNSTDGTDLEFAIYNNTSCTGTDYIGREYSGALSSNTMYYVVATYDGGTSSTGIKLYVNGVQVDDTNDFGGTFASIKSITTPFEIGSGSTIYPFNGIIDEVRVSSGVRDANWIKFEYYNQSSATNELTFAAQETQSATVPGAPTGVSAATSSPNQATVSFTAPSNGGSSILYYLASSTPGNFTATSTVSPIVVTGLTNGTSYTFQVYAVNAVGTSTPSSASNAVTPTAAATVPTIATSPPTLVSTSTMTLNANISATGGASITGSGFAYGTASNLSTVIATTSLGSQGGTGNFGGGITGLSPNTLYYFRAYAVNSAGTSTGTILATTTLAVSAPTVTTQAVSTIGATTAIGNGNITATGSSNPTVRGVVYGTSLSYGATTTPETGSFSTGAFEASITGLTCNTLYHVAAYATNSQGTSYGSDVQFTTSACPQPDTSDKDNVLIYANKTGTARGYNLLWKAPDITGTYYQESVVAYNDGVAYLTSTAVGTGKPGNRDLFALDAATGDIIARYTIGPSYGSPVIDGNTLYIGTSDESWDPDTGWAGAQGLYSFDISNIRTSGFSLNWFHADTGKVAYPVTYDATHVYYDQFEGTQFVALNKSDGSVAWTFTEGEYGVVTPLLHDNAIYTVGGSTFYKINATNGSQIWAETLSNATWDNSITYDGDNNALYLAMYSDNGVASYDLNGNLRWHKSLNCSPLSDTAYHNNVVFFSDTCGYVYALNEANGNNVWGPVRIGDGVSDGTDIGSVTISGGLIFIGTTHNPVFGTAGQGLGKFYALDESTGNILWQYHEPDLGNIDSPASIANGIFFNETAYWDVYAFEVGDGSSNWLYARYDQDNSSYSPSGLTTSRYVSSTCTNNNATTTCSISNSYAGRAVGTKLEMENETIKSVTLNNGDYQIYVNGGVVYLPVIAASGSVNNLAINSGASSSYDTSIPRLTAVSPTTDNVLTSSYDPISKEVDLSFDNTSSITATVKSYNQAFLHATSTISSDASTSISATGLSGTTNIDSVPLAITPSAGSIAVTINTWNTSGDYSKEWTETGDADAHNDNATASHTVGNLQANTYYVVNVDQTKYGTYESNSSGQITFTYNGGYSTHTFDVVQNNPVTPTLSVTNSPVTYTGSAQAATVTGSVAGTVSSVLYNGLATVPTAAGTYAITANFAPTDSTDYSSLTGASAGNFVINSDITSSSGGGGTISGTMSVGYQDITPTQVITPAPTAPTTIPAAFLKVVLTKNLELHDTGKDVRTLQEFLNSHGFIIASKGAGSPDNETTTFGMLTYKALIKFQKSQGLPQTGYLGPLTRAAILKFK